MLGFNEKQVLFAPPPGQPVTFLPPAPTRVHQLDGRLITNGTAKAGQDYHYQVALTNSSGEDVAFSSPCPQYLQRFINQTARYLLNCSGIRAISPGATAVFDMVVHIPADTTNNIWTLSWVLLPPFASDVNLQGSITVVR
jgi:hypothetical protein